MNWLTINRLCKQYGIDEKILELINLCEKEIENYFHSIQEIKEYNQYKVIEAMQNNRLTYSDFAGNTGYGYGDIGRDKVEQIYAHIFNTEDALVRPIIASGTHALTLTLSGILRPNDELISISGSPYDTMQEIIGIKDTAEKGTLKEYGIVYKELPLVDNLIDVEKVIETITKRTKILMIQRSTGYSNRRALTIDEIKEAIEKIKEVNKDVIIMVDNCYGEFVDYLEPTDVGADIMAGSLIKNPGGGIAVSGGYIVGKEYLVKQVANRLTAPGLGKECGLTFGTTRTTLQGLFLAPQVVSEALKGAILLSKVGEKLGFKTVPKVDDDRSDIIQGIEFLSPERVVEFIKGIQQASPVDSFVSPEAWEMPGYQDKVIMASGGFIEGSSIELSADGPMRKPYYVYYQGGLTFEHAKLGIAMAINNLYNKDLITI